MVTFTVGSHNLLFALKQRGWFKDMSKSSQADIVGHQEGIDRGPREAVRTFSRENGRKYYMPRGANAITWDSSVFKGIRNEKGSVKVHDANPKERFKPARSFTWRGLKHKTSGDRVLVINVHAISGYTQKGTDWDDWAATQMWLDVVSFAAMQMSRDFWDLIVLLGDFNAEMTNKARWYYPARILLSLFEPDEMKKDLDHILLARGSRAKVVERWCEDENVRSDHPLHFAKITLG